MTDTTNEDAVATMRIDASDLIDGTLDWAIMAAQGEPPADGEGLTDDERYSTNWALGGPLLQRLVAEEFLRISAGTQPRGRSGESLPRFQATTDNWIHIYRGDTMLIAGFRAYVAWKLGHFVNVPVQYLPRAKPLRRIRVKVTEELTETNVMELNIPDELDLADKEAVNDFLEEAFAQGHYDKDDNEYGVAVEERGFSELEVIG